MNVLSKKLRELENNIVSDIPKTPTRLYIEDATEREIHKRAIELLQRQHSIAEQFHDILKENPKAEINIHALDFTPDEKAIVDKSNALYHHRVMELFDVTIAQYCHLNDHLKSSALIPDNGIMILTHRDDLVEQITKLIQEFNRISSRKIRVW